MFVRHCAGSLPIKVVDLALQFVCAFDRRPVRADEIYSQHRRRLRTGPEECRCRDSAVSLSSLLCFLSSDGSPLRDRSISPASQGEDCSRRGKREGVTFAACQKVERFIRLPAINLET